MTIARTICLGFLTLIIIGTILLMLPFATESGTWNNPLVALFTATSAVCVTGLIVVDTGSYFSFWGELFILTLIQLGGLGYMTTTTFLILLIGRRFDLRQKFAIQESFDRPFLQGSQNLVRSIIGMTIIFELTGAFLLMAKFVADFGLNEGLWLSIFHSISAWNNAGFSLFEDSLVGYQGSILVNLVVTVLVIFGGIGYQVIIEGYIFIANKLKGKKARFVFSLNFKVVVSTSLFLLILGAISFFLTELNNPETLAILSTKDKLLAAWFQSVITRTAGFNTISIGEMTTAALFIAIALMFIGASPSGTGGGIKTTTFRIIASATRAILRGKEHVPLFEREITYSIVLKAVGVVFGSVVTIIIGTFILSVTDPDFNFIQIFFEEVSAFATVGLSTGITAALSDLGKIIIILTMYIGRVGVLIFVASIIGDPRPSRIQYPEENLLVG
ncbi:MAG: TrkH family potassium uptake protein [Chroococcales cyanobacterium]